MELVERASRLTLDQRLKERKELERAEAIFLAEARKKEGPFWRKVLEQSVATRENISQRTARRAFGDLLIDGVFRMYDGDGEGDVISTFRRR